jgi:hypothetical protein
MEALHAVRNLILYALNDPNNVSVDLRKVEPKEKKYVECLDVKMIPTDQCPECLVHFC